MKSSKLFNHENKKDENKSNNKFDNIKTDYFLEKLFNILTKKKSLDLIKYNKNMKKRININISIITKNFQKNFHQLK